MKNKKGFTLIELLGVISLLAVIALIALPSVTNLISNNQQKTYNMQIKNLEDSLKAYASNHVFAFTNGSKLTLTLYQLAEEGYTDYIVKNPITKTNFPIDMLLTIEKTNSGFKYNVLVDTGTNIYDDSKLNNLGVLELNKDYVSEFNIANYEDYIKTSSSSVSVEEIDGYYLYTMSNPNDTEVSVIMNVIN